MNTEGAGWYKRIDGKKANNVKVHTCACGWEYMSTCMCAHVHLCALVSAYVCMHVMCGGYVQTSRVRMSF